MLKTPFIKTPVRNNPPFFYLFFINKTFYTTNDTLIIMVKDSSKKHKIKEAEKVKEVIVEKVVEPSTETPEPTIQEVKKPSKMPKHIEKPKVKPKKLIQTGKENESNALLDESKKVATGQSMGLIFGITIAVAIIAGVSYLAYTKLFKKNSKLKDLPVDQIKSIDGVKKLEN
jgi:hypothetical protein